MSTEIFCCQGRPRLAADVTIGSLFIRGWDGDTVRVEDCRGAEVKQAGNKIVFNSFTACHCRVYLPRKSDIIIDGTDLDIDLAGISGQGQIDFNNGSLSVENWQGDLTVDCTDAKIWLSQCRGKIVADSSGGDVEIRSSHGSFVCDTGSGSLELCDCTGSISADTGSGSVRIHRFSGPVHVDTGGGGVEMRQVFGRNVRIDCGSGSIAATLPSPVPGRWELVTRSGDIEIQVPENISARFRLKAKKMDADCLSLESSVQGGGCQGCLGQGEGTILATSVLGMVEAHLVPAVAYTEAGWKIQDDEALEILRMLEQGAITIDAADDLLAALNGEGEKPLGGID